MRFLLDEDLPPRAAEVARGLGLDATSVHEVGRRGLADSDQLRFASGEGRIFLTRNRRDFIELTVEFYRAGEAYAGVLLVSRSLPNDRPERIAQPSNVGPTPEPAYLPPSTAWISYETLKGR